MLQALLDLCVSSNFANATTLPHVAMVATVRKMDPNFVGPQKSKAGFQRLHVLLFILRDTHFCQSPIFAWSPLSDHGEAIAGVHLWLCSFFLGVPQGPQPLGNWVHPRLSVVRSTERLHHKVRLASPGLCHRSKRSSHSRIFSSRNPSPRNGCHPWAGWWAAAGIHHRRPIQAGSDASKGCPQHAGLQVPSWDLTPYRHWSGRCDTT